MRKELEKERGVFIPLDIFQMLIQRGFGQMNFLFQIARFADENGEIKINNEGKAKLGIKLGLSRTRIQSLIINAKKFELVEQEGNQMSLSKRFAVVLKKDGEINKLPSHVQEGVFIPIKALNFFSQVGYGHIGFILFLILESDANGDFEMTPQTISRIGVSLGISSMRSRTLFSEAKKLKTIVEKDGVIWTINPEKIRIFKGGLTMEQMYGF